MNFLRSYIADANPNQSFFWKGDVKIFGGEPGQIADKYEGRP
jgi:hypothetical protein